MRNTHVRRRDRFATVALAVVATMAALVGCSSSDEGGDDGAQTVRVGLITKNTTNPAIAAIRDGAQAEADSRDDVELFVDEATSDDDDLDQIARVENMLTRGVDVLAIVPLSDALIPVLTKAAEDIPVILIDSDLPTWDGETAFIGTDNATASEEGVTEVLTKAGISSGDAVQMSFPGIPVVEERVTGASAALAAAGVNEAQVVGGRCGVDPQETVDVGTDIFTAHPDVAVIIANCGQNATLVARAAELAGVDMDSVLIIGFDGVQDEFTSIKDGTGVDYTIAQRFDIMGATAVDLGVKAASGESIPAVTSTETTVVDKDNVEEFIK